MIENQCHKYETFPELLPNNWLWDSIDSKIDFINYKCNDKEPSKYSTYCSPFDK